MKSNRARVAPVLLTAFFLVPVSGKSQTTTPTPTPTCNPTQADARFEPDYGTDPTYSPGDQFPLTLMPANMEDWPTTPSFYEWDSTIPGASYRGDVPTYTVVIPDPAPDTVEVYAWTRGLGIRSECGGWSTSYVWFTARRFDYNPTPSPTSSATPSPTPTPDCTPAYCRDYVVYPPPGMLDVPLTVVIELTSGTLEGLFAYWTGYHPITQLDQHRWLAENVHPDTIYGMEISCIDSCTGQPVAPSILFKTRAAPTPTPGANGWVVRGEDGTTSGSLPAPSPQRDGAPPTPKGY